MSESAKPGKSRAEAARQELADLHRQMMDRQEDFQNRARRGDFDNIELLDKDAEDQPADNVEHTEHTEPVEPENTDTQPKRTSLNTWIAIYAQAELDDDKDVANEALGQIDDMVAKTTELHKLDKSQVDSIYDNIMDLAQTMANQWPDSSKKPDLEANSDSEVSDDLAPQAVYARAEVDDLSDLEQVRPQVDDLSDLGQPAPAVRDKVDDLHDLDIGRGTVDDLSDLKPATRGKVDDLSDVVVAESRGQVDSLDDIDVVDSKPNRRQGRIRRAGEFLKNTNFMAAAALSTAMFRAGQQLDKYRAYRGESAQGLERRRNNRTGQKVAVGALAVGAVVAWYLWDKNDGSGVFDWFGKWGNGHNDAPDITNLPTDTTNGGDMPGVAIDKSPVDIPEVKSGDTSTSVDVDTTMIIDTTPANEVPMPGLDSGSYSYPWNWADDKFGSQNSRKVLDSLVSQTDGACWHRLGDGIDTNDWISINGRSDSKYVIEQLSRTANNNPELVESMYRG